MNSLKKKENKFVIND